MKIFIYLILLCLPGVLQASSREVKMYEVTSPDGALRVQVETGERLLWSVEYSGGAVILPSPVSLQLEGGEVLGKMPRVDDVRIRKVDERIHTVNYVKDVVRDHYNELTLECEGGYSIIFRAYDDAAAYRFHTAKQGEITITNEEANFNFSADHTAWIPYMTDYRDGRIFNCSFESLYEVHRISHFKKDSLAFLPLLVDIGNGRKAVVLEADLEDYPGMFLTINGTGQGFRGVFAPVPLKSVHKGLNYIPVDRADYIARTKGTRSFPWRMVVISDEDRKLLDQDIVQKLAAPPRIEDVSWIVPGQVAWDWWNNWNVTHVGFRAGINTETYEYYIDFAAANGTRYIIMDEGWSVPGDLTGIRDGIDLPAIIGHGRDRGVGVILWATWYDVKDQMEEVFTKYSALGVKGFKIDFIDRDDQKAVASTYEIAKAAAAHRLMVDYHGIFKPTGLQRTWPNVVGYEGVQGLEYNKWSDQETPGNDATIPFIRMMAGPMDYTPGAMRNAAKGSFRAINSNPMSQGSRCHQLAMYVVYEAPLQMLSDNPTTYMNEQECTNFITSVPTTFDETVALEGKVGEYAVIARRKGDAWYVGALCDWEPRNLKLDFSFLGDGAWTATIFSDGINADRNGNDYSMETKGITAGDVMEIRLSSGGGWAARLDKTGR